MKRVFVTHDLPGRALDRLSTECQLEVWPGKYPPTAAELKDALRDCNGLLCLLTNRVDRELLENSKALEFVSSMSVGFDHVDVAALSERGIPLGNTPGVLVETTADLTWALLMSSARRICEADSFVRSGQWDPVSPWNPTMFVGQDIFGATLGIIGLGEIGRAVARRAKGFSMKIQGWTRSGRKVDGVTSVTLEELLKTSDYICVCVSLTPETRNLLDARAISTMKKGAVVVNTARGGIVDEQALALALASGDLHSAGIDVFAREPVPADNPLLKLANVVVAPHIGSASMKTRTAMANLAVANVLAALQGKPMPHCVNPEVYT